MNSLQGTEAASAAVATGPRVTLEHIERSIARVEYHHPEVCPHMTVAYVQMRNGFIVVGKSAPADPANFDVELGRKFARQDAIRQLWQLEGYLLRERLAEEIVPERGVEAKITLRKGYLGASISYPPEPGETWRRANDLPDGPATSQTLARILSDVAENLGEALQEEG